MIRLLIDEQLSPTLARQLARRQIFAQHVAHIGLAGVSDPELWSYAFAHDLIVVTMNARDFLQLAEDAELHAGLIVLRESGLSREEQWDRLASVMDHLVEIERDLVNTVIEVWSPGEFTIRDVSRSGSP